MGAVILSAGGAAAARQAVYKTTDAGVTSPVLIKDVKPMVVTHIDGVVRLTCVVGTDGKPYDIQVVTPLHPEQDREAVAVISRWQFKPGVKDGVAVPVMVDIEMAFAGQIGLRDHFRLGRKGVFHKGDPGVVLPVILSAVNPDYTPDARDGVAGTVVMDCVVLPDGTVGDVRIVRSLRADLDSEAVKTLRRWRFKPGTRDNVPVPVQVQIEIVFNRR